nr:ATP-binding protein [uncultured Holophaga sp.]
MTGRTATTLIRGLVFYRLFLPVLLLGVGTTLGLGCYNAVKLARQQTQESRALARLLDYHLEQAEQTLETLREASAGAGPQELARLVRGTLQANPNFASLYILDSTGHVRVHAPEPPALLGFDLGSLPGVRELGAGQGVAYSPPYLALGQNEPVVLLALRGLDGAPLVGELRLGMFQLEILERMRFLGGSDRIFIKDQKGTLIAHPELHLVQERSNLGPAFPPDRHHLSGDAWIYWGQGGLLLGTSTRIQRTGWVIVDEVPLTRFWRVYVLGAVLGTLVSVILWLVLRFGIRRSMLRRISTPLEGLHQRSIALSEGRYQEARGSASLEGIVELEALDRAFREAADRLEARENALRESESRFRLLMESSGDAIFLFQVGQNGLPGVFLAANRAACEQLGHSPEDLLRLTPAAITSPEALEHFPEQWSRFLREGHVVVQTELVSCGGMRRPVELRAQLIEADGILQGVAIARDTSERKRVEALSTAMESILSKGRMAAYVAHEINSPLAGIQNAFLLVGAAVPPTHPAHRYVALIQGEIRRISGIVRMMYECYRPASAAPSEVPLAPLIQEIQTLLDAKARGLGVTLRPVLPDPDLRATLSPDLFRQVAINLLQNALEASPRGGEVSCRAEARGDRLLFQVSDHGPGIPQAYSEQVFETGFSTKHSAGSQMGLGLGLGISRKLAEGMGGSLAFANHTPPPGCTFTLELPLVPPE